MTKPYAFFRGCLIPTKIPHLEAIARTILPELGIELIDIPEFSCCPDPIQFSGVDQVTWMTIAARNLCLAEGKNLDIITLCNGCVNTLAQTNSYLKSKPKLKEKINQHLSETNHQFKGEIEAKHFVQVILEDIGINYLNNYINNPLVNLKIATHTGCHLFSPQEIMKCDDPFDPTILDHMVSALGAEVVDYDLKPQCCGSSLTLSGKQDGSNKLIEDKLSNISASGADCIAVVCPFCYQQFDLGQLMAARKLKLDFTMPVLYYLQLLGLAMGYTLDDLHYIVHKVKNPFFEEKCNWERSS